MRHVILDGAVCAQRETAMPLLEAKLELPAWWGRNLDALSDCLWEAGEISVRVKNHRAMLVSPFGRALWQVLADTARENPRFQTAPVRRLRLGGRRSGRFLSLAK